MQLSEHFNYAELTVSETAARRRLNNKPTPTILKNLTTTAQRMEEVRRILGNKTIIVNSAYRSKIVNEAVGGSGTSAHCFGWAVDFICPSFGKPYDVCQAIMKSGIAFDQLIHEFGTWTHISFDPKMRRQPLTIGGRYKGYKPGILKI